MSDHLTLRRSQAAELRRRSAALRVTATSIESRSLALLISLVTMSGEDTWQGPVAMNARLAFGTALRTMSARITELRDLADRLDQRAELLLGW